MFLLSLTLLLGWFAPGCWAESLPEICNRAWFGKYECYKPTVLKLLPEDEPNTWGFWGEWAFCPNASNINGVYRIAVKSEKPQGGGSDDTAMNGIYVYCSEPFLSWSLPSARGKWGETSDIVKCPRCSQGMTGFRLKREKPVGSWDDTAANRIEMKCDDGTIVKPESATDWGSWTNWRFCPKNHIICGIRTRVADTLALFGDDTALNDVQFACCRMLMGKKYECRLPYFF